MVQIRSGFWLLGLGMTFGVKRFSVDLMGMDVYLSSVRRGRGDGPRLKAGTLL